MLTCISHTVSAMNVVDLPLRNNGNDMQFAKHLSTYALVFSKERLQNMKKRRGEAEDLATVQRSPCIGRISRTTSEDRHRY
jgi:hypothetical protein